MRPAVTAGLRPRRPAPRRGHRRCARRGVALVLVLITVVLTATLAYSFVAAQSTSINVARNIDNAGKARYLAESGIELALAEIRGNTSWRDDLPHGTWMTDEPLGSGTVTIVCQDGEDRDGDGVISVPAEGDGDLADDKEDVFTLTVTGKVPGAGARARVVVTPKGQSDALAHYKLDEGAGVIASDSTGRTSDAALQNDPGGSGWSTGKLSGAFDFDGGNDFFATPVSDTELQVGEDYTATVWIHAAPDQNSWAGIFSRCSPSGDDNHFTLQFDNSGGSSKRLTIYHPNGRSWRTNYRVSDCSGAWHHVAVTFTTSPARAQLYVDGTLHSETTSLTQAPGSDSGKLHIGAERTGSTSYVFRGKIDDLRIYDEVLTAEEIHQVYLEDGGGGGSAPTLTPAADTSIHWLLSFVNYGGCSWLQATTGGKALLRFDFSTVPAETTVTAARLSLMCTDSTSSGRTMDLHAITAANADWEEGNGCIEWANSGEACWRYRAYNAQSWAGSQGLSSAGIDYKTPALASLPASFTKGQRYTWELDVATVQGWIDDPDSHHGLTLQTSDWQLYYFGSKDDSNSDEWPRLEIDTGGASKGWVYAVDWRM